MYRAEADNPALNLDPNGELIFAVLVVLVIVAAAANTNPGAKFVVYAGDTVSGGRFSKWAAGSSRDYYARFAHRVDRYSLGNQIHNAMGVGASSGAYRYPKGMPMPGKPSTTSFWTQVFRGNTGVYVGRVFNWACFIEGGYNALMIPYAAIYTAFDGGEEDDD